LVALLFAIPVTVYTRPNGDASGQVSLAPCHSMSP
jgi:hypothetical protein